MCTNRIRPSVQHRSFSFQQHECFGYGARLSAVSFVPRVVFGAHSRGLLFFAFVKQSIRSASSRKIPPHECGARVRYPKANRRGTGSLAATRENRKATFSSWSKFKSRRRVVEGHDVGFSWQALDAHFRMRAFISLGPTGLPHVASKVQTAGRTRRKGCQSVFSYIRWPLRCKLTA